MIVKTFSKGAVVAAQTGTSPPQVIALHGWGRDRTDWHASLSRYDTWLVDLPGFGASPRPPQVWDTYDYARVVLPIIAASAARPTIVAHSFGGRVALHIAAELGDQLGGLVLIGVPLLRIHDVRRLDGAYSAARAMRRLGLVSAARLERMRRKRGSADYRAAEGVMRDVLVTAINEDYSSVMRKVACDTALVWGSEDTTTPVAVAVAAQQYLRRSTLQVVDGAGHFVHLDAPDTIACAVRRIVDVDA